MTEQITLHSGGRGLRIFREIKQEQRRKSQKVSLGKENHERTGVCLEYVEERGGYNIGNAGCYHT